MGVLDGVRQLADFLDRTRVPAPHSIHCTYPERDEAWVRRLAASPDLATRVGLRPKPVIGPTRSRSGHVGLDVRLSWFSYQDEPIDRGTAAGVLRLLVDLAAAGEMPAPSRVDAMCALRSLGHPARLLVRETALQLGDRPLEGDGQVLVTHLVAPAVSYTVHGFLR